MSIGGVIALIGAAALAEVMLGLLFISLYSVFASVRTRNLLQEAAELRAIEARQQLEVARAMADFSSCPCGGCRKSAAELDETPPL